jgi:hypothetical protein
MRGGKRFAALLALTACQTQNADPSTHAALPAHSGVMIGVDRGALFAAEQRRDSSAVDREALSSR